MPRLRSWMSLMLLLVPATATAQRSAPPSPDRGARVSARCEFVRMRPARCGERFHPRTVEGRLRGSVGDTLRLRPEWGGADLVIPADLTERMWVVEGTETHFWQGAAIGLMAGAVLGAALGSMLEYDFMGNTSPATLPGLAVGAPAGFLLGGMIGAGVRTERWREVPLGP